MRRNNVAVSGVPGGWPIVFAHGFGCNQEAWRFVAPDFEVDYQVVLFDSVGARGSDLDAYDPGKYDSLHGYATDVLEILETLDLHDVVFVGHSVSAMVGVVAANRDPSRFGALVLLGPSPRYTDTDGYLGGWSHAIAPVIVGNPDRPALGHELTASFCATEPSIARHFARVTFLSDNRDDLGRVSVPTLVVQSAQDAIAPPTVGAYVHDRIPGSRLALLPCAGHCADLSAPEDVVAAIRSFLK